MISSLLCGLLLTVMVSVAQESPPADPAGAAKALGIYVTTQDFSSLREGPGLAFDRLTVVPAVTTLPAIGRSPDTRWLQVEYEGQFGWISSSLLVWNGDVSKLPLDGINPARFARKIGILGVTTRETPLYRTGVDASDQIGTLPAGTTVEVTARLGAARLMQFQIVYQGNVYWVGSWNLRITDATWRRLFDTSYLNPYGRLVGTIESEINSGTNTLNSIESLWVTLDSGQPVSCNFIPKEAALNRVTAADLAAEPVFAPVAEALQAGIDRTNAAITAFADACTRPLDQFYITDRELTQALDDLAAARRSFNLAQSLIRSLRARDPLVNPDAAPIQSF